jgi:hypothetical protein
VKALHLTIGEVALKYAANFTNFHKLRHKLRLRKEHKSKFGFEFVKICAICGGKNV